MNYAWIIVYSISSPTGGVSSTLPPYTQYSDKTQCELAVKDWPSAGYPVCGYSWQHVISYQSPSCGPLRCVKMRIL